MDNEAFLKKIKQWQGYIDRENLSEEENLIYQLNHDNDTEYTLDDVFFSNPIDIQELTIDITDPNKIPLGNNTRVVVTAKPTSKYYGSDDYCYRRLDLGIQWKILHGNKPFSLPREDMTLDEIKRYIRKRMPFREKSTTLTKEYQNGKLCVLLKPIENSLLYIGELRLCFGEENRCGPICKINKGKAIPKEMNGLDYHYQKGKLSLQGLDYHVQGTLQFTGLDYHTPTTISNPTVTPTPIPTTIGTTSFDYPTITNPSSLPSTVTSSGLHYLNYTLNP